MKLQQSVVCLKCHKDFQWTEQLHNEHYPRHCSACAAKTIEEHNQKALEKLTSDIIAATPLRFRQTDSNHPLFNRPLWQRIHDWDPTDERPWLGIVGPTGTSKTRCILLRLGTLLKGMFEPTKHPEKLPNIPKFKVISAYRFGEAVAAKATDIKDDAMEWLHQLRTADVLVIDDLGKQRNTQAVSAELFALIDHRHAHNLPLLWTANTLPERIASGIPEDLATPLVGRLRECSLIINLP